MSYSRLFVFPFVIVLLLSVWQTASAQDEAIPTKPVASATGTSPSVISETVDTDALTTDALDEVDVTENAVGLSTASGASTVDDAMTEAVHSVYSSAASTRSWLPVVTRDSWNPANPVAPLPQLANGNFDSVGGWTEIENGAPTVLIYPTASFPLAPISVPSNPRLAWLGGVPNRAVVHQLIQSVALPWDYDSGLKIDYYSQSAEPACGVDTAGVYVNGVLVDSSFPLCADQSSMAWSERTISLAAFRGQQITIEFRLTHNETLNSNLYLDNIELCGSHLGLPVARQCAPAGWQEVGGAAARGSGISTGMRNGRAPSMAISGDGRPWVAWQASIGSAPSEVFVKRWNGAAWEAMGGSATEGGISNNPGISARPSLAIVPAAASSVGSAFADMPYVAWHDLSQGAGEIYVRRWNGASWESVGAGSATGGGISNNPGESYDASLAITPQGEPWVAWTNLPAPGSGSADSEIYVRRFDGVSWVEVGAGSATGGGISNNSGISEEPSIAIGSDGSVFVAWTDDSSGDAEIYAKRWNGSAWVTVGANSASGGGISNNTESSRSPSLAVVSANQAYVAWVDRSGGDTEIYAMLWNGVAWSPAGANAASGGGISNNAGDSLEVSLSIGRNMLPFAAWTDLSSGGGGEIYARRWNGTTWQQVGTSATWGGISANPEYSSEPTAAVAPDGTPYVIWSNAVTGGSAVYARRYMTR